ncbi:hypothetical protein K488DRAFT_40709 [Vararia minispora EC-137]|uniref:Uncharacterized protein n=1 Tax=Vararia minispora EC-137 TaxID=1314806 RepID=A0ACB8QY90_9AGAM|nr:hypothetical protein K488DRAFT_40709 [Vararia minispora EC-137]
MPAPVLAPSPRAHAHPKQPRKKAPPSGLHIVTPVNNPPLLAVTGDDSVVTSAVTSATDDSDFFQFSPNGGSGGGAFVGAGGPKRTRNTKKLSLSIASAQSSTTSLIPGPEPPKSALPEASDRPRRMSAASLPVPTTTAALLRKEEDGGSPTAPYVDGPIEVLPKVWLGSEDNAREWPLLVDRGIGSVLNVAREVVTPFDSATSRPLRPISSTPNLKEPKQGTNTYYPPHKLSGRPGMHYLKLQWSHGQSDLVQKGFADAMTFVDQALERGEGILIHCQLGISRSATLVIALVMRAAATRAPNVPPEVRDLKGMQSAYAYVKSKSKWVGPNMSLIYQLLDYERTLRGDSSSPTSDISDSAAQDEEWGRKRQMLDEATSESEAEQESAEVQREAQALDKAMEERMLARKSSSSSIGSGLGMGAAWRSRYARKRAGSVASNVTSNSAISEDLVEEDEEQELLGVGGGFDGTSISTMSTSASAREEHDRSGDSSTDEDGAQFATPITARKPFGTRLQPPPALTLRFPAVPTTAPAHRSSRPSFNLPPIPATATVSSFDRTLRARPAPMSKSRRRPAPLGILPTVPDSPLQNIVVEQAASDIDTPLAIPRQRKESRRPSLPPLHLRHTAKPSTSSQVPLATPSSQTLFVFPPSPTMVARTPSAMTLTSNAVPFPALLATPRLSSTDKQGKRRSYIGILAPPTPTTAHSRVDARGWIGKQ